MMFALKKMQTTGSRAGSSAELFFKTSFFPSSLRKKAQGKKIRRVDCKKFISNTRIYQIFFFSLFFFFSFQSLKTCASNTKGARLVNTACSRNDAASVASLLRLCDFKQVLYNTCYVNILTVLLLTHRLNSSVKMASMNARLTSCVHTQYCL